MIVEAALSALDILLTWPNILYVVAGTILGLLVGVIPGLGGPVAIALLIPLTYQMDPRVAFLILGSAIGGQNFGGSITAILLNIPGSGPNAATLLDGYPMTQKGEGKMAIGASAIASAGGALFGLLVLVLLIPVLQSVVLLFGPPEFFWLAIIGITVGAFAGRGSMVAGIVTGLFGFLLTTHGFNVVDGAPRFYFGSAYLLSGIALLPVLLGLFAIAEMINLSARKTSVVQEGYERSSTLLDGIRATIRHWPTLLRSSVVGVLIGAVPAAGGTVATFMGYLLEKRVAPDPDSFGTGNVRGVIASEGANDAKDGGALMPTLALGIPGSAVMAVLLGGFTIHGMTAGPLLLLENLDVVFALIFALIISNVLTSTIGLLTSEQLAMVARMPIEFLGPAIVVLSLVGVFATNLQFVEIVATVLFGLVGYVMLRYRISRIPMIIGFVLGPIAEDSFFQSLQISQGDYAIFVTRPIPILFMAVIVLLVGTSLARRFGVRLPLLGRW